MDWGQIFSKWNSERYISGSSRGKVWKSPSDIGRAEIECNSLCELRRLTVTSKAFQLFHEQKQDEPNASRKTNMACINFRKWIHVCDHVILTQIKSHEYGDKMKVHIWQTNSINHGMSNDVNIWQQKSIQSQQIEPENQAVAKKTNGLLFSSAWNKRARARQPSGVDWGGEGDKIASADRLVQNSK